MNRGSVMKVCERMTPVVLTLDPEDPIRRLWEFVVEKGFRRFPVLSDGKLVGIVTERDLRNATVSSIVLTEKRYHDYLLDTVKVGSIMTPDPRTVTPDDDIREAANAILEMKVGGLPVVSGGELVGIITETDLIKTLLELLPPS